ncbi:thiol-disulfide isomerase/thioredoxin [Catalinimonas alkaloidigena]|uniref:TlpA family protein disulfide reductase n=1 Tax=Catalinimonas alkaloidigena TaxID=1075417 RepID=UPI002405B41A|nr:TlpA disulfide reductase family protein [Catalinimonas alkaloidigena]MDF9797903.1 thiol-disulfide isomerase/thioredoxin [Catalinimonas alkaloidigena]
MNTKKIITIAILAISIIGMVYLFAFDKPANKAEPHTEVIETQHTVQQNTSELINAEGEQLNFADFKGKVVFINNWASWCRPCIAEMPTIEKLKQEFSEEDLAFVMVSFDQDPNKGLEWMQKKEFDLPVYFPGQEYPQAYLTDIIPASFILDKEGKLVHTQMGMADYSSPEFIEQMKAWINQ